MGKYKRRGKLIVSVYHQMGHDSINLVNEPNLSNYSGAILSPVNYDEEKIIAQVKSMREKENFEAIFDPQLYFPQTERGKLREWSYFPNDVDTALVSSEKWWKKVTKDIVDTCVKINAHAACSPVFAPRSYTNDYYSMMISIGNHFHRQITQKGILPIQSMMVSLADLSNESRPQHIASIISQTKSDRLYLIFVSEITPRRELDDTEELKSAMQLIQLLENSGIKVIVGFCSSEFILWKVAGASSCATGKFFNLRRFTSSRFEEPTSGGGQLPYWFEEGLLSFLRDSDLIRVQKRNLISDETLKNPFSQLILKKMKDEPGSPWLSLSWRQFMFAFADLESRIVNDEICIANLLLEAENKWLEIEEIPILMEEIRNDGKWIRSWRRAVVEFNQ